ncbi:hypothetical protein [Micromonospora sp. CPCC 206061]|uniref:hypothetical protein n=1 Tax=Micromonospora sp. CPCC 206061 TaxID=3122410 RepID=UPI002FF4200E
MLAWLRSAVKRPTTVAGPHGSSALYAGLAGGAVMSAMMLAMRKAGKTSMDMSLIEGALFPACRNVSICAHQVQPL